MTPKEYLERALRTNGNHRDYWDMGSRMCTEDVKPLMHAGMGLVTESAEFLDALKKHVMYGKTLDKVNLIEELGDLFWYAAVACDTLGVTFEEVMDINIKKLQKRYPEKYTNENAINRDVEAEREILEGKSETDYGVS